MAEAQNEHVLREYHDIGESWVLGYPELEPHIELISQVACSAEEFMSSPEFDSSHDFAHIRRVVALARYIYTAENALPQKSSLSPNVLVVLLGALLHDVDDRKYLTEMPGRKSVHSILNQSGVDWNVASAVEEVVKNVSFSEEVKDLEAIQQVIHMHPELAYVQDADRLDALGAIGTARCFTYSAAKGRDMNCAVDHFSAKLFQLEGMMKTSTGRAMAEQRTKRMREFMRWWKDEKSVEDQGYCSMVS